MPELGVVNQEASASEIPAVRLDARWPFDVAVLLLIEDAKDSVRNIVSGRGSAWERTISSFRHVITAPYPKPTIIIEIIIDHRVPEGHLFKLMRSMTSGGGWVCSLEHGLDSLPEGRAPRTRLYNFRTVLVWLDVG